MKNSIIHILSIFFLCSFLKISAQGNLLITPKRVVFDATKRSYALNIANTGRDTARYEISLIHYRMKDDGSLERIAQPDSTQKFADNYFLFYPHNVVLAPNSSQTVRLQLTKTQGLDSGEYRTNLYFRAVPNENLFEQKKTDSDSGISMKIVPVIGISMPVFLQVGQSNTKTAFSKTFVDLVNDTLPILNTTFNRIGNMSVYGDVLVDHISAKGKLTRVGLIKGLAVYTPNLVRNFKLKLNAGKGVDYHTGKLHVIYSMPSNENAVLAETEIALH